MAEVRTTSSTGGQKGVKLARFDLIPQGPYTELAEHYGRGARKYADHQWRDGYEWSKSFAAKQRHDAQFWAGQDYDVCSNDPDGCSFVDADGEPYEPVEPDTCYNHTGSHHMAASAWHAFCLLEFKDRFPEHDDRYRPNAEVEPEQFEVEVETLSGWDLWDATAREAARYAIPFRFIAGIDGINDIGPDLLRKHKPVWSPEPEIGTGEMEFPIIAEEGVYSISEMDVDTVGPTD